MQTINHEDIAVRAYYIYVGEGYPEGRSFEHWLAAEQQAQAQVVEPALTPAPEEETSTEIAPGLSTPLLGGAVGGAIGALVAGPIGAVAGAALGALAFSKIDSEKAAAPHAPEVKTEES